MAGGKLTAMMISRMTKPGNYPDGGNLYLRITKRGGKSWAFRYKVRVAGKYKTHWVGLGSLDVMTLSEARERAHELRRLKFRGGDPLADERARRTGRHVGRPLGEVLDLYMEAHRSGWRNAKHAGQWRSTVETYAAPLLPLPVDAIDTEAILAVLKPIWTEKAETASRLRGRLEALINYATARGWRTGENPARWRGHLDKLLPPRSRVARVQHHPALPWQEIGPVFSALTESEGMAALCLRFLILTAARSGEARGARWSEIDLEAKVWTVPASRMKSGREHRVPLSAPALAILEEVLPLRRSASSLVFPGQRSGRPLSDVALAKALRIAIKASGEKDGEEATVHGMRSAFRDWCAEATNYPREVAEAALAHANPNRVESAYARTDHFEKRRALMEAWAEHCLRDPDTTASVVPIRA